MRELCRERAILVAEQHRAYPALSGGDEHASERRRVSQGVADALARSLRPVAAGLHAERGCLMCARWAGETRSVDGVGNPLAGGVARGRRTRLEQVSVSLCTARVGPGPGTHAEHAHKEPLDRCRRAACKAAQFGQRDVAVALFDQVGRQPLNQRRLGRLPGRLATQAGAKAGRTCRRRIGKEDNIRPRRATAGAGRAAEDAGRAHGVDEGRRGVAGEHLLPARVVCSGRGTVPRGEAQASRRRGLPACFSCFSCFCLRVE